LDFERKISNKNDLGLTEKNLQISGGQKHLGLERKGQQ
jgi:hypothetical protein